jgi:hypothetical protein
MQYRPIVTQQRPLIDYIIIGKMSFCIDKRACPTFSFGQRAFLQRAWEKEEANSVQVDVDIK